MHENRPPDLFVGAARWGTGYVRCSRCSFSYASIILSAVSRETPASCSSMGQKRPLLRPAMSALAFWRQSGSCPHERRPAGPSLGLRRVLERGCEPARHDPTDPLLR